MRASETVSGSFGRMLGAAGALSAGLGLAGLGKSVLDMGIAFDDLGNTWATVTHGSMAQMQQKAIELGNDLTLPSTSAADAEQAMVELAKGGLQAAQAMDAAKGTLQLAAAAGVDAATAAQIESDALNTFSLKGRDAGMVADLLAAAANASSGEITDMALSLQQAGAVFAAAHIPIQTTVTLISEMAQQGIRGSDAGTSLKTMMLALQKPTDQAARLMKELNLHLYDAKGRMRDFRDIIQDAQGPLSKLTQQQRDQALGTIFGSDAVRAANIVFGQGVKAFDDMAAAVTKQGVAADVAGAKSQGLGGALRGIQSQLETTGLRAYKFVEPALTALATDFGKMLPAAIDVAGGAIGGWVTGVAKELDTLARESGLKDLASDIRMIWGETHPAGAGGLHAADTGGDRTVPVPQVDNAAFGKLLGDRLVDAIKEAAPRLSQALGGLVTTAFAQVDWYALGKEAAPAFEGFAMAFVTEAMNPLLWTEAIKKHPLEGLVGVVSLATIILGPEELIGVRLAEALGRVPLVGIILKWAVKALNQNPLSRGMRDLGAFSGERILKGISEALTGSDETILVGLRALASRAGQALETFKTAAFSIFDDALQAIGRLIGAIADTVVVQPIRGMLALIDATLSGLIKIFLRVGGAAMDGLGAGLRAGWGVISDWVTGIGSRVWSAVGPTANMLWDRGYGIISGLLSGMQAAWGRVTSWVPGLTQWIAEHKGPLDVDRRLLVPHGRAIMAGFHEGLLREWPRVQGTIGGFSAAMAPNLAAATSAAFAPTIHQMSLADTNELLGDIHAQLDAIRQAVTPAPTFSNRAYRPA